MMDGKEKKRRKRPVDILSMLRYGTLVVLVIYVSLLIRNTGDENVPFETVAQAVEKAADAGNMKQAGSQELKRLYGLNEKDYDGVLLYYSQATMNVDEIFLVRAKTKTDARAVMDAAILRRDVQIQNFEGYAPDQVKLLKSSVVKLKGHYVLFVVSRDVGKYEKAFDKVL